MCAKATKIKKKVIFKEVFFSSVLICGILRDYKKFFWGKCDLVFKWKIKWSRNRCNLLFSYKFEFEYNKKGVVNYGKNAMCDSVRIQSMHKEQ